MPLNSIRRRDDHLGAIRGFSLIELLLALSLGIGLSGTILQLLISESDLGLRVNRLLRERSVQQRTLALIRDDVQRASRISSTPQLEQHACSLAGRLPVLHLSTAAGPITYSVGTAPSAIWRGQVLMRCGPAFDLEGQPSLGSTAQNRVVIDGLTSAPGSWQGCIGLMGNTNNTTNDTHVITESQNAAFATCTDHMETRIAVRLAQELPSKNRPNNQQKIETTMLISNLP